MGYDFDLGNFSRPLNTHSPDAQRWFDHGLIWLFGYNHEEAIKCFEKAIAADADLALAHWGIGYAIGPNYNKPWDVFTEEEKAPSLARAHGAIAAARKCATANSVEAALTKALAHRYPEDPGIEDFGPYNDAYAEAMRPVFQEFGGDLDIACLFAESLMVRTAWQLWDLQTGAPAENASTAEARAVLERAFSENPAAWKHPGLLHMYVHLMEMSPTPEAALRHGDALTGLVPDSGHLMHMATHIDVLCGEYSDVVARNRAATAVDVKYKNYAGGENFYSLYRIHNLHFQIYGAMFLAQPTEALKTADRLREEVPDEVVRVYPDLFEAFVAARPHVLIRFGMWEEILTEKIPSDTELFAFTIALYRYARTVALANLGRADKAAAERDRFLGAFDAIPESRMLFQNSARDVLAVAREMMLGEIAYKAGRVEKGLDHLRASVRLDDNLMYEEPWAWPQPSRHALGALLLDSGNWQEAEAVYRADLGLDPSFGRSHAVSYLRHGRSLCAIPCRYCATH